MKCLVVEWHMIIQRIQFILLLESNNLIWYKNRNTDGSVWRNKKTYRVYKTGYSAMTPEVYNGKVYVNGI